MPDPLLIQRIDAVLPQTQCRRCGYDGCHPYAVAVAEGSAQINRCPPGGDTVVGALAVLSGQPALALDPDCGLASETLAVIDEARCIGCTLCIQACPVDAIVGAAQQMHTVLAEACTGCELCLPPCPVDCIAMVPAPGPLHSDASRERNRARYAFHVWRLARDATEKKMRRATRARNAAGRQEQIARVVAAALERARKRRADLAK